MRSFVAFLLVGLILLCNGSHSEEEIDVNHPDVQMAAEFAVKELQRISNSGIYETLQLKRVLSAKTKPSSFHFNYILDIELVSPHLVVAPEASKHHVVVMKSITNGKLGLAIDEFPKMKEADVEDFWLIKRDAHMRERDESFAAMERKMMEKYMALQEEDNSATTGSRESVVEPRPVKSEL
eukprot:GILK01010851.1.p1 GENE.GILK01010851.1~~GILK01010851.1.p1  ORF type:complete len:181 (-),score=26.08 GILK01010851.1:250-792(-)